MKNLKITFLLALFFISSIMFSQSYVGHILDNYSGIHSVSYNPASIINSRFKTDINIASASVFGGSDYFGINVKDVLSSNSSFDFEDDAERFPKNDNNFFANVDVLGPSFMIKLNNKSSIGLITRARGIFNINNINGELYETISDDFDETESFDFDSSKLSATTHVWSEIGIAYGRILLQKPEHQINGGITLKYLQGAGSLYVSSPELQGNYNDPLENLTTQGTLNYGTSQDFDTDDIDFSDLSAGIGLDIGFSYEMKSTNTADSLPDGQKGYKLKLGLSITDIGKINYKNSTVNSYNMNNSVSTANFEDDLEAFLEDNYNGTETIETIKMKLPTALHVLLDYRFTKKLYASAYANLSLTKKGKELSNSVTNTVTVSPRFESKWLSIYTPLSYRQYGNIAFGAGFRVGPLTIGSGSVFTNLLSKRSKTTDIYVGLKIPIYR